MTMKAVLRDCSAHCGNSVLADGDGFGEWLCGDCREARRLMENHPAMVGQRNRSFGVSAAAGVDHVRMQAESASAPASATSEGMARRSVMMAELPRVDCGLAPMRHVDPAEHGAYVEMDSDYEPLMFDPKEMVGGWILTLLALGVFFVGLFEAIRGAGWLGEWLFAWAAR